MKYCLISNFQCTSTSNEDSRRFSDCEGGVTWLYFQSSASPEHLCWAQAAGGRCCRSPAPPAAPSRPGGHPEPQQRIYSPGVWKNTCSRPLREPTLLSHRTAMQMERVDHVSVTHFSNSRQPHVVIFAENKRKTTTTICALLSWWIKGFWNKDHIILKLREIQSLGDTPKLFWTAANTRLEKLIQKKLLKDPPPSHKLPFIKVSQLKTRGKKSYFT